MDVDFKKSSCEEDGCRNSSWALDLYLSAIENEFYLDEFVLTKYFSDANRRMGHVILRPTKFHAYLDDQRKARFITLPLQVSIFFWWPAYYLLSVWYFCRVLVSKLLHRATIVAAPAPIVVLAFSPASKTVIPRALGGQQGFTRIGWPWQEPDIPLTSWLTWKRLLRACRLTLIFPFYLRSVIRQKNLDKAFKLQTYDAFYFFSSLCFLEAIDGIPESIYFCNMYDRWAILLGGCIRKSQLCLVQHGYLDEDCAPPTRIRKVDVLYVFDERSRDIFLNRIVEHVEEVRYLSAQITLQPFETAGFAHNLLIIGQPTVWRLERALVEHLAPRYPGWSILIKPHPLYSPRVYEELEGFTNVKIIRARDFFPRVDLVIAYNSTLGLEYRASKQKVYFYEGSDLQSDLREVEGLLAGFDGVA